MRLFLGWMVPVVLALLAPAQAKDSLVIGVAQFPASLHPYISAQTVQYYTLGFAQRPITAFSSEGKPVCLLCAELPTLENGLARIEDQPDGSKGLAVTIKLKPGLQWGDGVPVTAGDIAFTWKLAHDPASGFSNVYLWSRASGVDVVDDQTAVLHLPRTLMTFQMWDYVLPEHLEGPIAAGAGSAIDYINHTLYNSAPTTPGLWNGPYVISQYNSGNSIELTPNPHWPGRPPAIKQVVVRLVDNTAALQANLLSGDVDMTPSGSGSPRIRRYRWSGSIRASSSFSIGPGFRMSGSICRRTMRCWPIYGCGRRCCWRWTARRWSTGCLAGTRRWRWAG